MFASQTPGMINKAFSYIGLILIYVISLLPMNVLYIFGTLGYWFLYYIAGYRKKVVRDNLSHAFPEKTKEEILAIEKRFFKYLAALIMEIIKTSTLSKTELQKRYTFKNTEKINHYLNQGISVLVCSAHYGNWEWGTLAFGLNFETSSYPIYKPLSNKVFDNWFYRIRTRFGNNMIAMKQTYRMLTETKDIPTVFCFGNDQAPQRSDSKYWVNFLNQPTAIQLGIEKIAKKTNRPVFYIKVSVAKKGYYEVDCVPLVTDPSKTNGHEITNLHVRFLENIIREEPAYWLWSHRRWKHQPQDEIIHSLSGEVSA